MVSHAWCGNAQVLFVGGARQRKPACVPLRIGLGRVDQRPVGELTRLLQKALWLLEVKRQRAVHHVLSSGKPDHVDWHGFTRFLASECFLASERRWPSGPRCLGAPRGSA
jgi:hypothetical protein